MHYVPHQRSLPPLPTSSLEFRPQPWQRSSLPARARPRSPSSHAWQRSSLPASHSSASTSKEEGNIYSRAPVRPSSYYEPEHLSKDYYHDERPRTPPKFYNYLRSSSSHNLYESLASDSFATDVNEKYSTDDLTPLNPRSHFRTLDRGFGSARSSQDIYRYTDSYLSERNKFDDLQSLERPYNHGRYNGGMNNFDYIDDSYRNHYDSYHHNDHTTNLNYHSEVPNVSPSYIDHQNSFTPRSTTRSNPSRHGSNDDLNSPIISIPPSPRSIAQSIKRENSYDRKSFCSKASYDCKSYGSRSSLRKDMNGQGVPPNYCEDNYSPVSKIESQTQAKFVYLKQPSPQNCTQVIATLVVSLGPLCAGLGKGYSSPALASMADLSAQGQHFAISKDQGSWVASLSLLGAFFGSLPAGMSIKYGRKRVLCIVALPFAMSWILTVLATNVYMLYVAAILGGICTAIISVVTPVYISEIAHPDIRGCLCSFSKMNSNVGMLISYLLGAFMNWRQLATVTAIAPACLFLTSLVIPETPSFLLYRGRDTEAMEALKWLRGSSTDISRELTTMKANIATMRRREHQKPMSIAPRELVRPLFITCGLMVFQKFSGANAFNFYAVPILSETFVGLNPYRAAVVVAFVQICAGMASSALVDTVGRRPLLVFSNMLMSAALAAFGCYVYLKGLNQNENMFSRQDWKESDWVPLFCILVIEIAYALGVSPISWLYIGELFPLKHRGFGALAASVSYACSFASVKTFVDLQNWLGLYGAFWFYATIAGVALVFTLLFVPETKGKSLQEMQAVEQQKETLI